MIPESRLIKSEICLRDLQNPADIFLTKKSTVRFLALSLGLIHPKETRTVLLDVLEALFEFHCKNTPPTTKDIVLRIGEMHQERQNEKAIYYHLLRIKSIGLIVRKKGHYYFSEFVEGRSLSSIIKDFYLKKFNDVFGSITLALDKLEKSY
ncbi:hypothetical protein HY990_01375 [Candidatus Micrarchaeota archaeon]|nr:hypothetical protein [Candidatus Micrarchaeota archaeon]